MRSSDVNGSLLFNTTRQAMKRIFSTLILASLCVCGCDIALTTTGGGSKPNEPTKPKVLVDNVWTNLADLVDAQSDANDPVMSTKMVLMITHLRTVQKLSDADVAKFYAADEFKSLKDKERAMTKSDSAKLRSL